MIEIIDINFQDIKSAIGCFFINSNDNFILIETGPSNRYNNIKKHLMAKKPN